MTGVLDRVDLRTRLAGRNRLELLLFRLGGRQRYGINVFKVREVIHCPSLVRLPDASDAVCGVAHLRGRTVGILDLSRALGGPAQERPDECFVIISEYNRTVQGFLVQGVERIVNIAWEEVHQPPAGLGRYSYLTAVTEVDGSLVEVIDVEKILAEVTGGRDDDDRPAAASPAADVKPVLVVDDSAIARKQITRALDRLGVSYHVACNGRQALDMLQQWAADETPIEEQLSMVISDIEMPEMDGYTFTKEIKQDSRTAGLYVLLHSSLSGVFNEAMVARVGADHFLAKFHAEELSQLVAARCGLPAPEAD